ncbi:MocR-like pyridoxine biosynthesis transcription factor PdxR [Schlesneria paludicola]|uniref:MocR-like pyridoxine biosynthesis transcription factor PdxR n=1 Tax=Schlesneria paludicola TaxID=360056 RepID=UPI00029AE861|nr:PLP-dependent aminotransferase family protein [Schlesneria paludicola]
MTTNGRTRRFDLDSIVLSHEGPETLQSQLRDQLRRAILEGRLHPNERVPSTRGLAATLGVGRITVATVYEQLTSEGYLVATVGSGTRVSKTLPERFLNAPKPKGPKPTGNAVSSLSAQGRKIAEFGRLINFDSGRPVPFRPHVPALDAFPREIWERLTTRRQKRLPRDLLARVDPLGYRPLRESVAGYLGASRGVRCTADDIVITAGVQQGIDLIARLLIDPGDRVWLEDPGYKVARPVLEMIGAEVISAPLDQDGFDIATATRTLPSPRLIYVSPSCQWPTGVTMPLARRLELLSWVERSGAWVLEDDYTGEFRYGGRPLPALQGLDRSGRVIYMGTFSKVLFPSLRLGYFVAPPGLAEAFGVARWLADRHSPPLEQAVLADFIDGGHFARHIRQMRTLYAERQAAVVDAAQKELSTALIIPPAQAGMHLVAHTTGVSQEAAMAAASKAGIAFHPVAWYSTRTPLPSGLILGYAAYTPEASRRAMKAWARALDTAPRSIPTDAIA